jgi:hypothetical protein
MSALAKKKTALPAKWGLCVCLCVLRDVLFVRWGCLANPTVSCLCAGGEKQNFFLYIKILFIQDNFWYLSFLS